MDIIAFFFTIQPSTMSQWYDRLLISLSNPFQGSSTGPRPLDYYYYQQLDVTSPLVVESESWKQRGKIRGSCTSVRHGRENAAGPSLPFARF